MQFTELQEFVNDFVQRTWHKFKITYGDYMWLLLKYMHLSHMIKNRVMTELVNKRQVTAVYADVYLYEIVLYRRFKINL